MYKNVMSLCQFYNCGVIYVKIMGMIGNKQTLMNFSNNTILDSLNYNWVNSMVL